MRDDEIGRQSFLLPLSQALPEQFLGFYVQGARKVVKDQQLRFTDKGAGSGHALYLPTRRSFQRTSPASCGNKPSRDFNKVVFPAPTRPVMTVKEPRTSERSTPITPVPFSP